MKYVKIILLVVSVVATWFVSFVYALGCNWGQLIDKYFDCTISAPLSFVLAIGISATSLIIGVGIFKSGHFFHYKKISLSYLFFYFLITLLVLFNLFLTDYQKLVYIGGMTLNSCEEGKSIYPWGFTYSSRTYKNPSGERYTKERYTKECYLFHNKCEALSGNEQNRCYFRNKHAFNEDKDCAILSDILVQEKCKKDATLKIDMQSCFSTDTSTKYSANDFRLFNICLSEVVGIPFRSAPNTVNLLKMTDVQIWTTCKNQLEGVEVDVCLSNLAQLTQRRNVCNAISNNIPLLKKICLDSISR